METCVGDDSPQNTIDTADPDAAVSQVHKTEGRPPEEQRNSALFVLHCIARKLCRSREEFAEHFTLGLQYPSYLSQLDNEHSLTGDDERRYSLTTRGEYAPSGFDVADSHND